MKTPQEWLNENNFWTSITKYECRQAMQRYAEYYHQEKLKESEIIKALSGEPIEDVKTITSTDYMQTRDLTDEEWLKLPKEEILQLYKNVYKMLTDKLKEEKPDQPAEALLTELDQYNPYPKTVFIPVKKSELKKVVKLLKDNSYSPDALFGHWSREVWDNCVLKASDFYKQKTKHDLKEDCGVRLTGEELFNLMEEFAAQKPVVNNRTIEREFAVIYENYLKDNDIQNPSSVLNLLHGLYAKLYCEISFPSQKPVVKMPSEEEIKEWANNNTDSMVHRGKLEMEYMIASKIAGANWLKSQIEVVELREELVKISDYTFEKALHVNYDTEQIEKYVDEYLNDK